MMTPKERWLAALRLRPVDRLPFWPKFDAAYLRAQADGEGGVRLDQGVPGTAVSTRCFPSGQKV